MSSLYDAVLDAPLVWPGHECVEVEPGPEVLLPARHPPRPPQSGQAAVVTGVEAEVLSVPALTVLHPDDEVRHVLTEVTAVVLLEHPGPVGKHQTSDTAEVRKRQELLALIDVKPLLRELI